MFAYDIHTFDTLSSTNDNVKEAIRNGCKQGYCVVAKQQVSGHGMRGRPWISPYGGLYMSVALKPKCDVSDLANITTPIGHCIKDVLQEMCEVKLAIKEPNDVILADGSQTPHKLVGISTEYLCNMLCLGIGINIFHTPIISNIETLEEKMDARNIPVYLCDIAKHKTRLSVDNIRMHVLFALRDKLDLWQ